MGLMPMAEKAKCPHCEISLQGEPIPEEARLHYAGKTHFIRTIE